MAYATLRSFSYLSGGTIYADPPGNTEPMLSFGANGYWRMGMGTNMALPGGGAWPVDANGAAIPFYLRGLHVSALPDMSSNWVMIGHNGPNGDPLSSLIFPGQSVPIMFPSDAAPLYTPGEYFDAHISHIDLNFAAYITFWWVSVS